MFKFYFLLLLTCSAFSIYGQPSIKLKKETENVILK